MSDQKITFIGAGNMANSIIGGLIQQGYTPEAITACDPNSASLNGLNERFTIQTTSDNNAACTHCDVIILAVKPQILKTVVQDLRTTLLARAQNLPLIISIAAGISSEHIAHWLEQDIAIVRCMPNTPALVQQGASGLYANTHTNTQQRDTAQQLLQSVGDITWLEDETLIDAVTAVSGSGPAYFFLLMEAMIEAGVKQGLSQDQAAQLTLQTALGAATLAKSSDVGVDELRRRVTSAGGTTEQAILCFDNAGFKDIVDEAMHQCAQRSQAMAKELS